MALRTINNSPSGNRDRCCRLMDIHILILIILLDWFGWVTFRDPSRQPNVRPRGSLRFLEGLSYTSPMNTLGPWDQRMDATWIVLSLCICVLVQMLGLPVTLLSLFTASDMLTESVFEDPSVLPPVPELLPSSVLRLSVVWYSMPALPVLAISVFHPPLT